MFLINNRKRLIAFPSKASILTFVFDETHGIEEGSMTLEKTFSGIGP